MFYMTKIKELIFNHHVFITCSLTLFMSIGLLYPSHLLAIGRPKTILQADIADGSVVTYRHHLNITKENPAIFCIDHSVKPGCMELEDSWASFLVPVPKGVTPALLSKQNADDIYRAIMGEEGNDDPFIACCTKTTDDDPVVPTMSEIHGNTTAKRAKRSPVGEAVPAIRIPGQGTPGTMEETAVVYRYCSSSGNKDGTPPGLWPASSFLGVERKNMNV